MTLPPRPMRLPLGRRVAQGAAGSALAVLLSTATAGAADRVLPLVGTDMVMRGGQDELVLPFQLPPGELIDDAVLTIGYENALAVLPDASRLTVWLNGKALATLPATAAQGLLKAQLEIPGSFLQPGLNRLALGGELRHRVSCTRTALDELWVKLPAAETSLRVATSDPRPLHLADLADLLAASRDDGRPFAIAAARPIGDAQALVWGRAIAEGVALRHGQTIAFSDERALLAPTIAEPLSAFERLRGRNVALVGTADALQVVVPGLGNIYDGTIMVRRLPADPAHLAIIITGPDAAAVDRAATLFADPAVAWPASEETTVGALRSVAPADPADLLQAGTTVPFSRLGFTTRATTLGFIGQYEIEVEFPPTLYAGDGQDLVLELNYAYRAGLAATSALMILVDGQPQNMVRLDRDPGAIIEGKRIKLPMGVFRPGRNRIGFQPVLEFATPGDCAAVDTVALSLFEDSRILVPDYASLAVQPDLGRFGAAGFPFADGDPGGHELIVAGEDAATIGAAWTLAGRLAQAAGRPLAGSATGFIPTSLGNNLLVVGAVDRLPPQLAQASPSSLARTSFAAGRLAPARAVAAAPQPGAAPGVTAANSLSPASEAREQWAERLRQADREGGSTTMLGRWLDRILSLAHAQTGAVVPLPDLRPITEPGPRDAALVTFRSPYRDDRTVTMLTARDAATLFVAAGRLAQPANWAKLEGGTLRWNSNGEGFISLPAGEPYLLAPPPTNVSDLLLIGRTFVSKRADYWLGLSFGLLVLLGVAMRYALRRRLESRL